MKFLYAAYIVTWTIHAAYIVSLIRRHHRLKRQLRELIPQKN